MSPRPAPQKTVKELCLVCGGGRWIPDPADASRSQPCPYCDALGWVSIDPRSLGAPPKPAPQPPRKP